MTDSNEGDPSACPFLHWELYSPQSWEMLDDSGKVQVRYATGLFSNAFLSPGVLTVRSFSFVSLLRL